MKTLSAGLVCGMAAAIYACGATTPTQPVTLSTAGGEIHVETTDPAGDAIRDSRVAIPPDLQQGLVDVAGGSVAFRLRTVPGTFNAALTRFTIELDLDQNPATGTSGVDYYVFVFPSGGRGADVARATANTYTVVGNVPVNYGANGSDLSVPLSMLGNDDGRFDYLVRAYSEEALQTIIDVMPNQGFAKAQ